MTALRPARPEDAGAIAAIYAHYVAVGAISFEDAAPDATGMRARMADGDGHYPWLVATDGAAVLGYAYASAWSARSAYRWTAETTIYLACDALGSGVGRSLYAALLATLAAQGFHQAIGRVSLPNAPSEALHAALGFVCAGTQQRVGYKGGRWVDVSLWQRSLAEPADPPQEPRPFSAVGPIRG